MKAKHFWGFLILCFALTGCNFGNESPTTSPDRIRTVAAMTVEAMKTESALGTPVPGTATVQPTEEPKPGEPTATLDAKGCDRAGFVRDVTIPDGSVVLPGMTFVKVWELENKGTCAWNPNYTLVFANDGNSMSGAASQPLITSGTIAPGSKVQVAITLTAPSQPNDYRGYWILRNDKGQTFGLGDNADKAFYVDITVKNTNSLLNLACAADWSTGAGRVPCSGTIGDPSGFVSTLKEPKLETGSIEDEPAIVVGPQQVVDGIIIGKYPAMTIPANSKFNTVVGCVYDANDCNARIIITYQAEGEAENVLADVIESYDDKFTKITVDLNTLGLSGKKVSFTFTVKTNGPAEDDRVFFLNPSLLQ